MNENYQIMKILLFIRVSTLVSAIFIIVMCVATYIVMGSLYSFATLICLPALAYGMWSTIPMSEETYQRKLRRIERKYEKRL